MASEHDNGENCELAPAWRRKVRSAYVREDRFGRVFHTATVIPSLLPTSFSSSIVLRLHALVAVAVISNAAQPPKLITFL